MYTELLVVACAAGAETESVHANKKAGTKMLDAAFGGSCCCWKDGKQDDAGGAAFGVAAVALLMIGVA